LLKESATGANAYVFTQDWYQLPDFSMDKISEADWAVILEAKDAINKVIEHAREQKRINANLSAAVAIYADGEIYDSLAKLEDELRFVLITSSASLNKLSDEQLGDATELDNLRVEVTPAEGTKCIRCWHVRDDVGSNATHPLLCTRCVSNIEGTGEVRYYA